MTFPRGFALIVSLFGGIFLVTPQAAAVEHPGSIGQDANCLGCHENKVSGKSVHSVMRSPCTVCHVTMTQGDMTTVSLSMPKTKICFACHQQAASSQLHTRAVKGLCVDCHDAHSSGRRMLLRDEVANLSGRRGK